MLLYWILLPIVWVLAHILFRFEVIGRENLKAVRDGRAYVIAPNHIANLDPVLIAITIFDWKRLRILAKEELFKNPLAGWFLRCMGAVSIERGKVSQDFAIAAFVFWQWIAADLLNCFPYQYFLAAIQFAEVFKGFRQVFNIPAHSNSIPSVSS